MATFKLQINGPLYNNIVSSTLSVDLWADIWYSEEGTGSPMHLLAVPNVTVHPSMASVPNSYYLMWHYNCLWILKG